MAMACFRQAKGMEAMVAELVEDPKTKAALFKSAGWMAVDCRCPEEALVFAEKAETAYPVDYILEECKKIRDIIKITTGGTE